MMTKHIFSAQEFAKFARTTRDTLVYYEKIGLLTPGRNRSNYRQYSHDQLATVNLIHTCQALGMKLSEIKELIDNRSPALICQLLEDKIRGIDDTIKDWKRARKLLCILRETIHSVLDVDETGITIQYIPKQSVTFGDLNDYSGNRDDYDALFSFYRSCSRKYPDMDMNFSVWGTFSKERIKRRDWRWPDRYYFNDPDGKDEKPAAFYVVGYRRGGYGQSTELYERLLDYIDTNGLTICGPSFEEYPLNEICTPDDSNYLMRIMITVDKTE